MKITKIKIIVLSVLSILFCFNSASAGVLDGISTSLGSTFQTLSGLSSDFNSFDVFEEDPFSSGGVENFDMLSIGKSVDNWALPNTNICNSVNSANLNKQISLSYWYKPDVSGGSISQFYLMDINDNTLFSFIGGNDNYWQNNYRIKTVKNSSVTWAYDNFNYQDFVPDSWFFLTYVIGDDFVRYYVNGTLMSEQNYTSSFVISDYSYTKFGFKIYKAKVSNIILYDSALSDSEVSSLYTSDPIIDLPSAFEITSPTMDEIKIKESSITVEGNCSTNGINRIAFTNVCSSFENLNYSVDCVDNSFSSSFYYNGISNWVVAVEKDSIAGDCVDYDDLMDVVVIEGIEVIEGYPDDWNFNYEYYDDFNISINYPNFNTALTLPYGSTEASVSFSFTYPSPLSPNVLFNIKQYDDNGNLITADYYNSYLTSMSDTNNHIVSLNASASPLHYVVQLFNDSELKRQFSFGVYISDFDAVINPDEFKYLFPRLVEKLKEKVIFNYYFAFHNGFYDMFNASSSAVAIDDLDITFNSVSGDGEYNLPIKIFSPSNEIVQRFTNGIRPYLTAFLWLLFATYIIFRISHLFSGNE